MDNHICEKKPQSVFISTTDWGAKDTRDAYMRVEIRLGDRAMATTFKINYCPFCGKPFTVEEKQNA